MEEEKDDEIKKEIRWFILSKMVRHRYWMHKHTSIHNLPRGLPYNLRNRNEVKKVIHELLKEFLISKPTNYGLEVSLDIKKKKEIEEFIAYGYGKFGQIK